MKDSKDRVQAARSQTNISGTITDSNIIVGNGNKVTIKNYSYFQSTPANLRRSFDALIADKIRNFVGRRFVFDALDEFLNKQNSGYFVIRGVPGIGKSAFMAKLVNDRGYVHHFNIASQNIRSTRAFLENICAQIIACYDLEHKEFPQNATDDSGFMVQCLSEAAAKIKDKNQKIVVAIDSLDEADRLGLASSVNNLFLPHSLPEGVYIVLTTRPLADVRLEVSHKQVLDLEANSAGNLQDITEYIEAFMQRPAMQARISTLGYKPDEFLTALRGKSQGNFMYLYHVLPDIEAGKLMPSSVDDLPDGLLDYYQRHWRQMRDGKEKEFDTLYEPIVCILGVAQEPVTVQQIATWTKLSQGQVKTSIQLWREFLEEEQVENEHRYRIYHASFQDFLKEQVDLARYDDMIIESYLSLMGEKS
jgi:hypothetical protein